MQATEWNPREVEYDPEIETVMLTCAVSGHYLRNLVETGLVVQALNEADGDELRLVALIKFVETFESLMAGGCRIGDAMATLRRGGWDEKLAVLAPQEVAQ